MGTVERAVNLENVAINHAGSRLPTAIAAKNNRRGSLLHGRCDGGMCISRVIREVACSRGLQMVFVNKAVLNSTPDLPFSFLVRLSLSRLNMAHDLRRAVYPTSYCRRSSAYRLLHLFHTFWKRHSGNGGAADA